MRNSIVRKESRLLCISFSLTLCLNISDHKNTMFFKDLGDLYLKNRKIGFWEGPFQNFIGWTGCDAQNGSTDIFVFGNIPCRVELTPAYQKHFSSQSLRRENPGRCCSFRASELRGCEWLCRYIFRYRFVCRRQREGEQPN